MVCARVSFAPASSLFIKDDDDDGEANLCTRPCFSSSTGDRDDDDDDDDDDDACKGFDDAMPRTRIM